MPAAALLWVTTDDQWAMSSDQVREMRGCMMMVTTTTTTCTHQKQHIETPAVRLQVSQSAHRNVLACHHLLSAAASSFRELASSTHHPCLCDACPLLSDIACHLIMKSGQHSCPQLNGSLVDCGIVLYEALDERGNRLIQCERDSRFSPCPFQKAMLRKSRDCPSVLSPPLLN